MSGMMKFAGCGLLLGLLTAFPQAASAKNGPARGLAPTSIKSGAAKRTFSRASTSRKAAVATVAGSKVRNGSGKVARSTHRHHRWSGRSRFGRGFAGSPTTFSAHRRHTSHVGRKPMSTARHTRSGKSFKASPAVKSSKKTS
jgi:hypothetical protein